MDRAILFRGKRTDNGEWVEGYYAKSGGSFILQDNGLTYGGFEMFEVSSETVCQYTGLTDKNGRKIFEGDIINDIDYGIMKCIYLHGSFVWYKEDGFEIECMKYVPVIEIIGNIFDNLELLEGGTE